MKRSYRSLCGAMCAVILSAFAFPPALAVTANTKEEVIYVVADPSGKVLSVDAVNIFMGGDVTDYGTYSSVRMLTTEDEIVTDGDKISISSDASRIYYQGTMDNAEIPWNISIEYMIDGEPVSPEKLPGMSGALEIRFNVTKNEKVQRGFFENYALQASFTLDAEKCSGISAEGATAANVGKNKQLTYTILPGKGIDTVITADVKDFEMGSVQINGIALNLSIDIDDAELISKTVKLERSVKELDAGAQELLSGSQQLTGGIEDMQNALALLNSRSSVLTDGSSEIVSAIEKVNGALSGASFTASDISKLTEASAQIYEGIEKLEDSVSLLEDSVNYRSYKKILKDNGLDIDTVRSGNDQAIESLTQEISRLRTLVSVIRGIPVVNQYAGELSSNIESLSQVIRLLEGNSAAIDGTEKYLDAVNKSIGDLGGGAAKLREEYSRFNSAISELAGKLNGMADDLGELRDGVGTLLAGCTALDGGIGEYTGAVADILAGYKMIIDGTGSLAEGCKKLSLGTEQLAAGTSGMSGIVTDKIDEILGSIESPNEIVSFTSEKNTDISSVQFVIKTGEIEKESEAQDTGEKAEKLTFWQKLLRLFKLY